MRTSLRFLLTLAAFGATAVPAGATPVCTDGYMGGPPAALCGGRIFPEAALARGYVQYTQDKLGFMEYQHGIQYLAQKYPRWVSVFKLSDLYGNKAVSAGPDRIRPGAPGDTGDGREIQVIKITDHSVPDKGKESLLFSLSVHGNERGGLEGGLRTAEDLAIAATEGGWLADGVPNYKSATGKEPRFHQLPVKDVLAEEVIYFIDFNVDGWAVGDWWNPPAPSLYSRGNSIGTDLNRQMPTVGRIASGRNPLQESEAKYGTEFMHKVASEGVDGLMAYGADIHGELNSQAYMDIMYPAGEFDSVDHRRLMAIAERTKSVIDETLFEGIIDEKENATGGNDAEYARAIPVKPAHWATVWDTLGYTDTGFIGDYMATDLGVTGMDYEIMTNHTVPERTWNVYMQENHITATRGIIKTAMAYALYQRDEFNDENVKVITNGTAGYVVNPETVTNADGVGKAPPNGVKQVPYDVTNQQWFEDTNRLMPKKFKRVSAADVAESSGRLALLDTLVLADVAAPKDAEGRAYDKAAYYANLKSWVQSGGNLVLTDKAVHALGDMGIVAKTAVSNISVYQPFANFADFDHPLTAGLRPNARQLVETGPLGYELGSETATGSGSGANGAPMTAVATDAFEAAGGHVIGTTGLTYSGQDPAIDRNLDDGSLTTVGELKLGDGKIVVIGGALPMPTEKYDHRYGLRNYAMTYTGLFLMENAIRYDAPGLGD